MLYAYIEQDNGCDYTIACGKKLVTLRAATIEAAAAELFDENGHALGSCLDEGLERITIFEVAPSAMHKVDLDQVRREISLKREAELLRSKEASEREEYERLKAKFGSR